MELGRTQVKGLRDEVELEQSLRRKAESLSRALARELSEERAEREATERLCEALAETLVKEREEMERVMEERRMMRVAEAMREERVRMKLSEARIAMEEKLREMEEVKELRESMGVSLSVMELYGQFDFSLGLAEEACERGKRSSVCKGYRNRAQLRMLLLTKDKDHTY